jgi:pilus assembly protein Flp/PilA
MNVCESADRVLRSVFLGNLTASFQKGCGKDIVDTGIRERITPMRKFAQAFVDFVKREDGPTAVEYAVMLALIIVVCLAAITTLGQNANSTFNTVGQKIGSASS